MAIAAEEREGPVKAAKKAAPKKAKKAAKKTAKKMGGSKKK